MEKKGLIKGIGTTTNRFYQVAEDTAEAVAEEVAEADKMKSEAHIPISKPKHVSEIKPMSQYVHRLQRNYKLLNKPELMQSTELRLVQMHNNSYWQGQGFKITNNLLELEGIKLISSYQLPTDTHLKPLAEAYADAVARAIASKYGLEIGEGATIQIEIEQVRHGLTRRIKGKGLVPIHFDPKTKQPDLWTDLSFGLRGLESNKAEVLAKMTELARQIIDHDMFNKMIKLGEVHNSNIGNLVDLGQINSTLIDKLTALAQAQAQNQLNLDKTVTAFNKEMKLHRQAYKNLASASKSIKQLADVMYGEAQMRKQKKLI